MVKYVRFLHGWLISPIFLGTQFKYKVRDILWLAVVISTTTGTISQLCREDNIQEPEYCREGSHPGQAQHSQGEGGQGGGGGRD